MKSFRRIHICNFKIHDFVSLIKVPIVGNQTSNYVIDMDLESTSSQGLGDHDERFRIQTPPIIESICNQLHPSYNEPSQISTESNNNIIQFDQPKQIELPLSEPNLLTNDITLTPNVEEIESLSNETNNIDDDDDDSKQIIIPNSSVDIDDDSNCSRDEFVKLLTKEAYILKSPSPSQTLNHRTRSYDNNDDESNSNKKLSTTRTVTLVSNNHEDKLIIQTTNTDQQKEEEEEEQQQPTVKRIKVDLVPPPPPTDGLFSSILPIIYLFAVFVLEKKSLVTIIDDHDYRQDFDERRRQSETLRSRSRSKSASSRNSSIKDSKTRSPSPSSSHSSSINNRYHQSRRNEYNRSSDRSYHYHQRNINNFISSHSQQRRHQRFNYNHQSVLDHPRFAHVDTLPSPEKQLNYNSFSTSNYSQSMTNTNRK
jgi:hypothetical protein